MSRKLAILVAAVPLPDCRARWHPEPRHRQFPAGSSGLGDPYFPLDGNGGYDVQHYDLALTYDPATDRLTGIATITARATQNLSAFNFDFIGMRLRSLTVNGATAKTSRKGQELTVKPATGLTNGSTFTVVARYDGVPQPIFEEGLGDLGFLPTEDGAIVQGEPHVAATWFPANDHPRDKASFAFHITIPTGLEAIANGVLTEPAAERRLDDLELERRRADGAVPGDDGHRRLRRRRDTRPTGSPIGTPSTPTSWSSSAPAVTPGGRRAVPLLADLANRPTSGSPRRSPYRPAARPCRSRSTGIRRATWTSSSSSRAPRAATTGPPSRMLNGHSSPGHRGVPVHLRDFNPFLDHYLTPVVVDPGRSRTPGRRLLPAATPSARAATGTPPAARATAGRPGPSRWPTPAARRDRSRCRSPTPATGSSRAAASILDELAVSTASGLDRLRSRRQHARRLDHATPRPTAASRTRTPGYVRTSFRPYPGWAPAPSCRSTASRRSSPGSPTSSGRTRSAASGGIVHDGAVGFALENQTRPNYSPFFFGPGESNDFVVVHELAHQWFGDLLAVDTWNETWLNEGFATYAEWMWGEHEGFFTPQDVYDDLTSIPADDGFWDLAIGDPGIPNIFAGQIYDRGALTLHALRLEVGDNKFFQILPAWVAAQAGGTVTTREFIDLAESIYKKDLDPLFAEWLSAGKPASLEDTHGNPNARGHAGKLEDRVRAPRQGGDPQSEPIGTSTL